MAKPRKHKVLVEITDMHGNLTDKEVVRIIKDGLNDRFFILNCQTRPYKYQNLQVKNFKKVIAAINFWNKAKGRKHAK